MRLKIAGIVHNDVLGRERLFKWLQEAKTTEESLPAFIAVEYDEEIFRRIRAQRPVFRRLAVEAWPGVPSSVLKAIEESLVYEGDLHETVFPGIETAWLDQGRTVNDPTCISQYAQDRIKIYRSFIPDGLLELGEGSLMHMSIVAWDQGSLPQPGGSERDVKFAQLILERSRREISEWAIVIVGLNHASEVDGHMVRRLKDEGTIECAVTELRPVMSKTARSL